MKYLKQTGIILLLTLTGEVLHYLIPLPVPAGIYGLILLFLLLCLKVIKLSDIKETAHFLTGIMQIMFIPAVVGLIDVWGVIRESLFSYLVMIVMVTVIVMAVSGSVTQFIIRKGKGKNE